MSVPITDSVLRAGAALRLTLGERALLLALAFRADDAGAVTYSHAAIGRQIGIPKSNASRLFASLARKNLVATQDRTTFINTPAIQAAATEGYQCDDRKGYHDDNPEVIKVMTKGYHDDNPEVIKVMTKGYHDNNHINIDLKDTHTAQARAREADLDTFLAAYPAHKRAADPKDALADAYAEAIKEATPAQLLAALEAQKATRQWTEADGRYVATPLNWLTRRTYRAFLPDAKAAEAAKASKQVDDRLASLRYRADDGATDDLAGKEAGAYLYAAQARSALIVLHLALAGDPLPPQTLRTLANDVAGIDLAYAALPDALTFEGNRLAIAPIIREARAILRRPATQKGS